MRRQVTKHSSLVLEAQDYLQVPNTMHTKLWKFGLIILKEEHNIYWHDKIIMIY